MVSWRKIDAKDVRGIRYQELNVEIQVTRYLTVIKPHPSSNLGETTNLTISISVERL